MPVDHPDLDPLWDVMNDTHLPILHHSFTFEAPYFPPATAICGTTWWWPGLPPTNGARPGWLSYLIVGKIFDRFPNINAGAAEVGHGWLPHWLIRLGEMGQLRLGRHHTTGLQAH